MHIDDLKYLRNPIYGYGPWLSVGQVSKNGRFPDNPGDPANWSNSYTQYIGEAAWRSYQIHGGQPQVLVNLARYAEQDVKGQLSFYDHDGDRVSSTTGVRSPATTPTRSRSTGGPAGSTGPRVPTSTAAPEPRPRPTRPWAIRPRPTR